MINKRGDLWIIPFFNESVFHRDILNGQDHTEAIIEFVRLNQLPLQIKADDYHDGPCLLASMGYMIVKSEINSSLLIFYIPSVITENQKDWFLDHRYLSIEYSKIGGYNLKQTWEPIHGFEAIRSEIIKKYSYEKENHLGK